jgi:hypothetical protein
MHAAQIEAFADEFEAQRYAGHNRSLALLRRRLRQLRRSLPWRFSTPKTLEEK